MFQKVRETISALARIHRITEIITGLIIPVLVGLLAEYQNKLLADAPFLFWGLLAVLAIAAITLTVSSLGVKSAPEVYLDLQHERETNRNVARDIRYCTLLESECIAMNVLIREYASTRIMTPEALADAIKNICEGFVAERTAYFDFDHGEMWNFAVYLWKPADARLEPVWREKARNHPSTGPGRNWGDNEGHIGHAFHNRKELITSDAQAAEVAALMGGGNNQRPYDATTYRAYVSEPILATGPDAVPHGVLIATSDKVSRYDPANARVLKHASVALATLIETAYDSP